MAEKVLLEVLQPAVQEVLYAGRPEDQSRELLAARGLANAFRRPGSALDFGAG